MIFYRRNTGIFSIIIAVVVILVVLSFVTSILFSPIGLMLIVGGIGYHYYKKWKMQLKEDKKSEVEIHDDRMDSKIDENPFEESFSREAEDIDYKNID